MGLLQESEEWKQLLDALSGQVGSRGRTGPRRHTRADGRAEDWTNDILHSLYHKSYRRRLNRSSPRLRAGWVRMCYGTNRSESFPWTPHTSPPPQASTESGVCGVGNQVPQDRVWVLGWNSYFVLSLNSSDLSHN